MANALRSEFLGATLTRTEISQTRGAERVQTQALFNKKTAKKVEKKVEKKVQKVQKTATKTASKATKQVKKAASGKRTKGWFGEAGGAQGLDKWYGKYLQDPSSCSFLYFTSNTIVDDHTCMACRPFTRPVPAGRPSRPI